LICITCTTWLSNAKVLLDAVISGTINIGKIWSQSRHFNSYLHLYSIITAPRQKFKNLTYQFHHINKINLHAKFQPSSFKTVGGDSRDRRTKFYFSTIPYRISKHPPCASLRRDYSISYYLFQMTTNFPSPNSNLNSSLMIPFALMDPNSTQPSKMDPQIPGSIYMLSDQEKILWISFLIALLMLISGIYIFCCYYSLKGKLDLVKNLLSICKEELRKNFV